MKIKRTEFDNFTDRLYDVIFEETTKYLSDCIGEDDWGEELHEAHSTIMYNSIEAITKIMGIK